MKFSGRKTRVRQKWEREAQWRRKCSVTEELERKAWKVKLGSYVVVFLRSDICFALVRLLSEFLFMILCLWMLLVAQLHFVSRARKILSFSFAFRKNAV